MNCRELALTYAIGAEPSASERDASAADLLNAFAYAREIHAALPFLHRVSQSHPERWSPTLARELTREKIGLALLDAELDAAGEALARADVPYILVKGAHLGRLYPSRFLRGMKDVDLLLAPTDFSRATQALGREGFRAIGDEPGRSDRRKLELAREGHAGVIELHSELARSPEFTRRAWQTARPGTELPSLPPGCQLLDPTYHLAFLIQHACVQHILESPMWIADLDLLVRNATIDWDLFARLRAELRIRAASLLALEFARALFATPIPDAVLAAISREAPRAQARRLRDASTRPREWFLSHPRSTAWVARHRLLLRDSLWGAMREYGWSRWREHPTASPL